MELVDPLLVASLLPFSLHVSHDHTSCYFEVALNDSTLTSAVRYFDAFDAVAVLNHVILPRRIRVEGRWQKDVVELQIIDDGPDS